MKNKDNFITFLVKSVIVIAGTLSFLTAVLCEQYVSALFLLGITLLFAEIVSIFEKFNGER